MSRILSGSVRMSALRHDGREALYLIFEPGDCFGTSSLVDGDPRPQTPSARGEVELQVFPLTEDQNACGVKAAAAP